MGKRKSLNGLPENLVRSYFDTIRYYSCGYLSDWLINSSIKFNLSEITLDIINARVEPSDLNLYPFIINLHEIKPIIAKELNGNGFPPDFIVEAKINVKFTIPIESKRFIKCYPFLIDKNGNKYAPGLVIETASGTEFDPFDETNLYPVGPKEKYFERLEKLFGDKYFSNELS